MIFIVFIAIVMIILYLVALISPHFAEKKADRKAEKIKADYMDGSYFNSAEWKKSHSEYVKNYNFEKISLEGMKADLKRRYLKMTIKPLIFLSIIMLFCLVIAFSVTELFIAVLFIFLIVDFIILKVSCMPVKKFYKQNYNFAGIEKSYKNGKMLSHRKNGINIGQNYTVIYNEKQIVAVDNYNIESVERYAVRKKTYYNSQYAKEEYLHRVYIKAGSRYFVELDEHQVEIAIDELNKI